MLCSGKNMRAELRFTRPNSEVRTVRLSFVWAPEVTGTSVILVVCHDLTDFKERVELEKDRELISTLQHEEKNTHLAQQEDAVRTIDMLGSIHVSAILATLAVLAAPRVGCTDCTRCTSCTCGTLYNCHTCYAPHAHNTHFNHYAHSPYSPCSLQRRLVEQRDIALEYHPDWHDFFSSHKLSSESLSQVILMP